MNAETKQKLETLMAQSRELETQIHDELVKLYPEGTVVEYTHGRGRRQGRVIHPRSWCRPGTIRVKTLPKKPPRVGRQSYKHDDVSVLRADVVIVSMT